MLQNNTESAVKFKPVGLESSCIAKDHRHRTLIDDNYEKKDKMKILNLLAPEGEVSTMSRTGFKGAK